MRYCLPSSSASPKRAGGHIVALSMGSKALSQSVPGKGVDKRTERFSYNNVWYCLSPSSSCREGRSMELGKPLAFSPLRPDMYHK